MLRAIILLMFLTITHHNANSSASILKEPDEGVEAELFAKSLSDNAIKAVISSAKNEIREFVEQHHGAISDLDELANSNETFNPNTQGQLLVFVSTSMPIELLKQYFKGTSRYKGALVFNGLPGGSFAELTKLIIGFEEDSKLAKENIAGSIISDEEFKKYNITSVPAVVLVKEEECFEMSSCKYTYDKIVGNIGVNAALEKFSEAGELKAIASRLLLNKKRDSGI